MLGEKYGWIPLEISEELVELEPWLGEQREKSVTELEILHGVLNNPEMADHANFYFRDPHYVYSLPADRREEHLEGPTQDEIEKLGRDDAESRAENRRQKLVVLKDRIRASGISFAGAHTVYTDNEMPRHMRGKRGLMRSGDACAVRRRFKGQPVSANCLDSSDQIEASGNTLRSLEPHTPFCPSSPFFLPGVVQFRDFSEGAAFSIVRNWPLIITVIIAFAAFGHAMSGMISPEMYREMSPPALGYVFVPDDDTFTESEHRLDVRFVPFGPEAPTRVTAWISRTLTETPEPLEFEPLIYQGEPTDTWFAVLPPLPNKSDRWFYYITIETSEGHSVELWKRMNWFEKLFSGFKKERQHFWVTYEGSVVREMRGGKLVFVGHIVLAFGALLFLFHALYFALSLISGQENHHLIKAYRSVFWAWLTFTVGTLVLGPPITWYTFGCGFMPWPTQGLTSLGDVTDTKSTWLSIWWAVLLLGNLRSYLSAVGGELETSRGRRFAWWIIVSLIVTILVFLIPHSQFMQSGG